MTAVLDSWALLRYLEGAEPAAGAVDGLLRRRRGPRPVISWINLGEVFYVLRRARGEDAAAEAVRDLRAVVDPELPSSDMVLAAARIKADHPVAYADAFAAATAVAHRAPLWTGDPELLIVGAPWLWRDLR